MLIKLPGSLINPILNDEKTVEALQHFPHSSLFGNSGIDLPAACQNHELQSD